MSQEKGGRESEQETSKDSERERNSEAGTMRQTW